MTDESCLQLEKQDFGIIVSEFGIIMEINDSQLKKDDSEKDVILGWRWIEKSRVQSEKHRNETECVWAGISIDLKNSQCWKQFFEIDEIPLWRVIEDSFLQPEKQELGSEVIETGTTIVINDSQFWKEDTERNEMLSEGWLSEAAYSRRNRRMVG